MPETPVMRWEIPQGADWTRVVTWYTDVARTLPKDITSYTARMHFRQTRSSSTTLLELSTGGSGITLGDALGTVTVTITAAQASSLPVGRVVAQMELVSGSGVVTRLYELEGTVTKEVTR